MQPYGRQKTGSGKIHSHNKCCICAENGFNKKKARQLGKRLIDEALRQTEEVLKCQKM